MKYRILETLKCVAWTRFVFFLLVLMSFSIPGQAAYIESWKYEASVVQDGITFRPQGNNTHDGTYYNDKKDADECWLVVTDIPDLSEVTVPDSVEIQRLYRNKYGFEFKQTVKRPVTIIEQRAVEDCANLEVIHISTEVVSLPFFYDSPKLREIDLASGNRTYSVVDGALYSKDGKSLFTVFPGREMPQTYTIAESVSYIAPYAFSDCPVSAFIVAPGNGHLCAVDGILCQLKNTSANVTDTVVYRVPPARTGTLSLPMTANASYYYTVDDDAFYGTSLDTLILYDHTNKNFQRFSSYGFLKNYPKDRCLYANRAYEAIKQAWDYPRDLGGLIVSEPLSVTLGSVCFKLARTELCGVELDGVTVDFKWSDAVVKKNGNVYMVENLPPGRQYKVNLSFHDGKFWRQITQSWSTAWPVTEFSLRQASQSRLVFHCGIKGDATVSFEEYGVLCGQTYYPADAEGCVVIKDLNPATSYRACLYGRFAEGLYDNDVYFPYTDLNTFVSQPMDFRTEGITLGMECQLGPSTIALTGTCASGDAEIEEYGFEGGEKNTDKLLLTGLEPGTEKSFKFFVRTKTGYYQSVDSVYTTPELQLVTMAPRSVSATCTVAVASTNLSEDEPSVGFQWKKYDAPESLKPREGYSAIYGGRLEGYIKNLQPTSYYNVRAFYRSASDTYYYGDWVTFDPSDFSYFEPSVHTYPVQESAAGQVKLKGYVMAGTDEITGQGFQYWVQDVGGDVRISPESGDMVTVSAEGQVMSVLLTGLNPATTYGYRAFAQTGNGKFYGEEQTFTTSGDATGISHVEKEHEEVTITGYYDLQGRRRKSLAKGLNIIRYSDGSARKLLIK